VKCPRIVFLLSFFLLASTKLFAQMDADIQTGMVPYSAYHGGDIDNVNLSNGNLIVKIPIISYPQRGGKLRLNYELVFNGKGVVLTKFCTPTAAGTTPICELMWGPVVQMGDPEVALGTFPLDDDQDVVATGTIVPVVHTDETIDDNYMTFTNADSSSHASLPLTITGNVMQEAIDGSGYIVGAPYVMNDTQGCTAYCYVRDGDGISYQSSSNVYREDSNGNQLTYSGTVLTDTFGRQIPQAVPTSDATGCTGPLPFLSASIWQVPGYNGGTLTYKFCLATQTINIPSTTTQPEYSPTSETVLQSVVLPNGQTWAFSFGSRNPGDDPSVNYGDLAQVTFPTGGSIAYTYSLRQGAFGNTSMWVATRTENAADGNTYSPWTYTYTNVTQATTTVTDPLGNDTVHTFASAFSPWEVSSVSYAGSASSGNVLKTVATSYYTQWASGNPVSDPSGQTPQGELPQSITTTVGNEVTEKTFTYGATFATVLGTANYGLLTGSAIYDYGSGSPGALLRQETTSYLFQLSPQYLTDNLLKLVSNHTVLGPSGNTVSQQGLAYDESAYLTTTSSIAQHGTPLTAVRGNLTSTTDWLSGGASPMSYTNWYDTGEAYQVIDPRNNATTYQYSTAYAASLPTTVTNAKGQSTSYTYDFDLGVKTSATDPNNQTTTWSYDTLGRTTGITRPNVFPGTGTHAQATICYDDVAAECTTSSPVNAVVVTEAVAPSTNLQEEEQVDGYGRKTLTRLLTDPDGLTYTRTSYDALGRTSQVWNPTRCNPMTATSCSGEGTWGVTTHFYDAINREVTTIPADGSTLSDHVTIAYSGNQTTTTDEAGISHQSTTDALGRLTQVTESNMGWTTLYQYDPLGNLLCVEQHGPVTSTGCSSSSSDDATSLWRVRRFTYDTLSRLLTAHNPENGTITYQYDAASNLTSRTDASGITINYSPSGSPIDALNRVTEKTYSDGEPTISYTYDSTSVTNGVGRRTGMSDASGSTTWNYDPAGKVTSEARTINGVSKTLSTSYDLLDSPYQITYPSGAIVQYTPSAAGRVLSAVDVTHGINYMTEAKYAPSGAMATSTYGAGGSFNGIALTDSYNSRLQPSLLQAVAGSTTLLSLGYNFGLGVNDNGNVLSITNNKNSVRNQSFGYDGVNRLTSAQSGTWGVQFNYDAWGNMTQTSGITGSGLTNPMPEPADRSASVGNQVSSSLVRYVYAANGDMTADGSGLTYTYNGENQISSAAGIAYTYDGDGERVVKGSQTVQPVSGSSGSITVSGTEQQTSTPTPGSASINITGTEGTHTVCTTATAAVDPNLAPIKPPPPVCTTTYDRGTLTVSLDGFTAPATYEEGSTDATVAAALAAALNGAGTPVRASSSGSVVSLTSIATGASSNYTLSITNGADFSGAGSAATLVGGGAGTTVSDSGTIAATLNGDTTTIAWGNGTAGGTSTTSIASALATAIQAADGSFLTASASGATVTLKSTATGAATNWQVSAVVADTSGQYSTPSFSAAASGMAGGSNGTSSGGTMYWGSLAESDTAGNLTSEYVFVGGQRVARRDVATGNVYFYLSDHLGSSSVVTNASGVIQNESDFYPFGGENIVTENLSNQKYKFTGKERDTETGNDYFGARYYSSTLGRFMSPDWAAKAEPIPYAKLENPQSLNLYAYVQGNVETGVDHDGHLKSMEEVRDDNDLGDSSGEGQMEILVTAGMSDMGYDLDVAQAKNAADTSSTASPQAGQPPAQQQNPNQAVGNTTEGSLAKVLTNEDGSLSTPKGGNAQELVDGKTALANAIYNNADSAHPQKVAPDTGTASGQDSQIMQGVVTSRTNGGADPVQGRVYYGTSHTPDLTSRSAGNGLKGAAGRESVFAKFGPFKDSISSRPTYIYIYNNPGH
jgi:RHS repeat-associated protein